MTKGQKKGKRKKKKIMAFAWPLCIMTVYFAYLYVHFMLKKNTHMKQNNSLHSQINGFCLVSNLNLGDQLCTSEFNLISHLCLIRSCGCTV